MKDKSAIDFFIIFIFKKAKVGKIYKSNYF
jgi:hypothetical protein